MRVAAIIAAAGRGVRSGCDIPKQYQPLGGRPVLWRAIRAFLDHPRIDCVLCVIHPDDRDLYRQVASGIESEKLLPPASGGETRQASVRAGLEALPETGIDIVLIHDGARPFVDAALIDRAIDSAARFGAAIPGVAMTDTIVRLTGDTLHSSLSRGELRAVQTPQAFRLDLIRDAHRAAAGREDFTDDGGVAMIQGHSVHIFPGDVRNIKITTQDDFARARAMLDGAMIARVATGYDVHAFGSGERVWLGGVAIPHEAGLVGHSDADVVLHALTDAVLGTISDGDIGQHFPPSDATWKGASSDCFLAFAVERLKERGGVIDHLDSTIVCEAPKIAPHRDAMRGRIAAISGVAIERVSVKATTSERLGFTGRREGIASFATATVRLPDR